MLLQGNSLNLRIKLWQISQSLSDRELSDRLTLERQSSYNYETCLELVLEATSSCIPILIV